MPYFGQEIFLKAQEKADLERPRNTVSRFCKIKILTQEKGIDAVMEKDKLDAIIAPSGGASWMIDLVNGDCGVFEDLTSSSIRRSPVIRTSPFPPVSFKNCRSECHFSDALFPNRL